MIENSHLSFKNFKLNKTEKYNQSNALDKPKGLWYQINGSWNEWCSIEMPQWLEKKIDWELSIDKSNVLIIDTLEKFNLFETKYCAKHPFLPSNNYINWKKVSKDYDGIEITNYIYSKRMSSMWYYTWDVASGCIWNLTKIKVLSCKEISINKTT